MSTSRKAKAEEAREAEDMPPPALSLAEALGIELNVNQGWTPLLSPDGAVIGARGGDGTKVHTRIAPLSSVVLEFVR